MQGIAYWLKMVLLGLWTMIITPIFFLLCAIFWGSTTTSWLYARFLGWGCLRILRVELNTIGLENLPRTPSIVLANHQSNLDPFLLGMIFPKHTVIIGKKEMVKVPFFGVMLLATKNILINRTDKRGAVEAVKKSMRAVRKYHKNIWIFPEGTRSKGRGLGRFKKGAFHIAIATKAPIVCFVNQPIESVVDVRRKRAPGGTFTVKILPPIQTQDLKMKDAAQLQKSIEDIYRHEIATLIQGGA